MDEDVKEAEQAIYPQLTHVEGSVCHHCDVSKRVAAIITAARAEQKERIKKLEAVAEAAGEDGALNYWEPPCENMDCDKGYHVDHLKAYLKLKDAISRLEEK